MSDDLRIVDIDDVIDTRPVRWLLERAGEPVAGLVAEHRERSSTRVALGLAAGDQLVGAVLARTPRAGVCEILAVATVDDVGIGPLVDAAADELHAVAVWATVAPAHAERWSELGFALRPLAGHDDSEGTGCALRAERRHPPEPEGFHTEPIIDATDERELRVTLPPDTNTLPVVPEALRHQPLPGFVLRWLIDADEVGLLFQDLAPELFPPVTPAVRPPSIRPSLGSLAPVLGDPDLDELAPAEGVPGLPVGLHVPVRVVELLAGAERIRSWLLEAKRVQAWAEAEGHGDERWIEHAPWEPHAPMIPELDEPRLGPLES